QQLANSWDESFWAVCALPRDRFRFLLSPVVSPAPLAPRRHPPRGQRGCRTPENLTFWAVVTRMPRPGSSQKLSNPVGGRNFGFCAHPRHQNSMFLPPADTLDAYVGPRSSTGPHHQRSLPKGARQGLAPKRETLETGSRSTAAEAYWVTALAKGLMSLVRQRARTEPAGARDHYLHPLPAPLGLHPKRRGHKAVHVHELRVLGQATARARRPQGPAPHRRPRSRGPRRQPHRSYVHRRQLRQLAHRSIARPRLCQPAHIHPPRRRA